jgi:hypothetical protein
MTVGCRGPDRRSERPASSRSRGGRTAAPRSSHRLPAGDLHDLAPPGRPERMGLQLVPEGRTPTRPRAPPHRCRAECGAAGARCRTRRSRRPTARPLPWRTGCRALPRSSAPRPRPRLADGVLARALVVAHARPARSRLVQPRLQQHHGRRAVDDRARRPPLAPGRRQRTLRLDRGEALVGRLDRDAEGLEAWRSAATSRSAARAAGPLWPERLRGSPTTTVPPRPRSRSTTAAVARRVAAALHRAPGEARVRRLSL